MNNQALNPALNQRPVGFQNANQGSGNEVVTESPWKKTPPTPEAEAFLDQILKHWENSTADIQRYSCKFQRWQYKSTDNFVDELAKKTGRDIRTVNVSTAAGELKYMAPDKGMFKIDILLKLSGQLDAKNQPEYKSFDNSFGEWWLCDGEKVYEYDRSAKQCTRHTLPPEMKGAGILESPMPFMFGIKAEKIRARYWVRFMSAIKDQKGNDIYVIEAYPKFQSDAVNYDHVQIYLDRELFLPVRLNKYNTEHRDEAGEVLNDNREVFEFSDRQAEGSQKNVLQKFSGLFSKSFIPFDIPSDWKVEDKVFSPPAVDNVRAANNPGLPQPNGAPNSPNNLRK
jgi:TIGR03009 family protein